MRPLLTWLVATLLRTVGATLRVTLDDRAGILNKPDHAPVIIAFWHNRLALLALFNERYLSGRRTMTFISRSRDGQYITDLAARFGIEAVRGSSSKHGMAAALGAVHAASDPHLDLAITPDGPRGPRYEIRPGLLRLAQQTGRPIVAITYELSRKKELKSWDRFHIPLPFASCRLITMPPILVPAQATDAEMETIAARVKEALGGD